MELRDGRADPLPDYIGIVMEARYWRVTPMEILEWPVEWIRRGQIVRAAESQARQQNTGSPLE